MKYNSKNSVLNTDEWDFHSFSNVYETSKNFRESINNIAKRDGSKFGFMGDIFSSLYKYEPMLKSEIKTEVKTSHSSNEIDKSDILQEIMKLNNIEAIKEKYIPNPNETLVKKVLGNDAYKKMHENSKGDKLYSSISTMTMGEEIKSWFEKQEKSNQDYQNAQQENQQAERSLEKTLQAINKRSEKGQEPTAKQTEQLKNDLAGLMKSSEEIANLLKNNMNDNQISEIIEKSKQQANSSKEGLENLLGGANTGEAELKKIPIQNQIALADLFRKNEKVKEIAEMAGRFKAIAKKKQKQKHNETIERNGITVGGDIGRLIPQELAMYHNKATKLDFLRRFSESQTLMYSPRGKEILGKGAMVVVLDESGSMDRLNAQSKGFVIALAMIAKKQKRDLVIIPFSNKLGEILTFEKGKVTMEHIVKLATNFLGGGTNYTPALNLAVEIIEQKKRFKQSDIIFVTDGEPGDRNHLYKFIPTFNEFKKKTDSQLISLLIGSEFSDEVIELTKSFSNEVIVSSSFLEEATNILSI